MTSTVGMEQLYQQVILDHAKNARGAGLRQPYDAESHQVNPTCGDEITLRVRLAGGAVEDVSYDALGCSISQAAASVLTELVVGRPLADTHAVYKAYLAMLQSKGADAGDESVLGDGVAFAGVSRYAARVKCALLPWAAYRDALLRADHTSTTEGRS
ncbi:MAG: SUF system NifU family Fe-S cluster assembly protein [Actinomycetota bacterium]|jgi:nitrogen fixation NifU-like protein|nr:SUF system NifU family Fe-S cluster assembly protein [Actinomycetota bacterium]MDQ3449621.1 SUF system NifU family Fe-S cluster assembly protein [Actinomycetota bacterium]